MAKATREERIKRYKQLGLNPPWNIKTKKQLKYEFANKSLFEKIVYLASQEQESKKMALKYKNQLEQARKMIEDNPLVYTRREVYEAIGLHPNYLNDYIRKKGLDKFMRTKTSTESYRPISKEKLMRYYKAYNSNFKAD